MILIAGSVVLAVLNQTVTILIALKWRPAWLVLMAAQVPNSAYDIITRQYGFIAISFISLVVGWKAWRKWEYVDPAR